MLLLRQLFEVAGGGPETDAFKHLAAAFTVLRSLGSAKTTSNSESSRIVRIFNFFFLAFNLKISYEFFIEHLRLNGDRQEKMVLTRKDGKGFIL